MIVGHWRAGLCVTLAGMALGIAGCHKQARQVYSPPLPAIATVDHASSVTTPPPDTHADLPQVRLPEMKGKPDEIEFGLASWYGPPYHNRKGADGSVYD